MGNSQFLCQLQSVGCWDEEEFKKESDEYNVGAWEAMWCGKPGLPPCLKHPPRSNLYRRILPKPYMFSGKVWQYDYKKGTLPAPFQFEGKVWHIDILLKPLCDEIKGEFVANNDDQTLKLHGSSNHCIVTMDAESCEASNGTWHEVDSGYCFPKSLKERVVRGTVNGTVSGGTEQVDLSPNTISSVAIVVVIIGVVVLLMHTVSTCARYRAARVRRDLDAAEVQINYQDDVDEKVALVEGQQDV